jgi:dTDP-4-amino-4,6-dideoxygalactose transaminase
MQIPFVDLKAQYASIKREVDAAIAEVIENTAFIGGPAVKRFEENFARYAGAGYAVGAASGTAAIHLALAGLGIHEGEVVTACNTFIATSEAITHAGCTPVFVDVDEATQLIDPAAVDAAITPRTRAIVPVHLYGQPADMDAIRAVADKHGLKVIADAAQAHGAGIADDRRRIHGDVTTYSFYPGKNLGAYGDAGAVVSDDEELTQRMKALSNHGRLDKYRHFAEGWNYRLDGIQAAVLDVKLAHLDSWTERRRSRAARYNDHFESVAGVTPIAEVPGRRHVYHLYVVRCADRDGLREALQAKGIASGIHYPLPLHLQPAYEHLGYRRGQLPVAEKVTGEIVSLPMYPELDDEMVDAVATAVREFVS